MVLLTQSTVTHKPITEEDLQAAGIPARFIDEALRTSRWMEERRITGDVPTDRSSNLHNLKALARRDPYYTFGLSLDSHWDEA
ncbi:MAG: phosphatase, partial [Aeriscardovia aeriphila]|nr:phosphatase [Aeriscardovia aeriphila]